MNYRLKTLAAAVLVALGASANAASISEVLPSYARDRYAVKRDDGALLFWGHQTYATNYLGHSGGCNDAPLGSSWCNWRVLNTASATSTKGLMNYQTLTARSIFGASATADKVVSASNNDNNDQGIAWYLSSGKLYAIKKSYTQYSGSFTSLIPSSDMIPTEIASANTVGDITDALVDVKSNTVLGVYFVTASGDLYYYGKKPATVVVSTSVIADDVVAATSPVKIASGISRLFASRTGTDGYTKLGVVDTNGQAWVYSATAGISPTNISTSQGIGTVNNLSVVNNGNYVHTVMLSDQGVFAELNAGYGYVVTTNGTTNDKTQMRFYQVANVLPPDIKDGKISIVNSGTATIALFLSQDGTLMGFGGAPSSLNPIGKPTLTATEVALVDPAWKATVTATKDSVAGKVDIGITPPSSAGALRIYRATTSDGNGTLIATVVGNTTSYQDSPPNGNSYWYYVIGETTDGKTGVRSTAVEGRANVAPTSVSASGAVVNGQSVTMTPTITDPNSGDTFTVTVPTPPTHGTATVNASNQITYTASDASFAGTDSFQFSVADQLGNTTLGNVTVNVTCAVPIVTGQGQDPIVEWGQGTIQVNYSAQGCHTNLTAKVDLLDPLTNEVVMTNTTATLATGNSQTLNFVVKDLPAKNYTAKLTFQSDQVAPNTSTLASAVAVASTSNPVLSVEKTTWSEDEQATLTVTMPVDSNCPLTTDQTVAQANRSYCYAEATEIPLGLVQETVPGQLKVAGYGMPKTNTPFKYQVSKWDSQGNKHIVKSNVVTLSFLEAPAPTFELFSSATNVTAVKDLVATDLRQTSGATCPVFTDQAAAQAELAKGKRACLATFTTPTDAIMQYDATAKRFSGRFKGGVSGQQSFGYQVQRLYLDKAALGVAEGTLNFNVSDFSSAPAFAVSLNKARVVRNVDNVVATVSQLSGEPCTLTASATDAKTSWYAEGMPKCLVTWGTLPGGMTATGLSASGKIAAPGTFQVPVNVSVVNPDSTAEISVDTNKSLLAILPEGPPFTYDGTPVLPNTNLYAVGEDGVMGKVTVTDDALGNVSMSIDTGGAAPEVHRGIKKGGVRPLAITPGELWSIKNVVVTTLWEDFPDVTNSMTIRAVQMPPAGMQADMQLPRRIVSTLPVEVSVSIGLPKNTGLRFDASRMGAWNGYLGAVQADGSITPLTEPTAIEGGKTTLIYPKAGDLNNAQIVFVAEVDSGLEGYTAKLVSKPGKITVVDGSGIASTLSSDYSSGAAPFRVKMRAEISPDQAKVLGKSEWLISNNNGETWAAIERANGTSVNYTFENAGVYQVKTKITNRYSGEVAYSEPITISAYALPSLSIDGPTVVRVGATASLTANSQASNIKWIVEKPDGTVQTVTGANLSLDSTMPQVIKATAMASNESGEALNDSAAWEAKKVDIRFINLTPLKVSVSGPRNLEVGEEGVFEGSTGTDWDNAAAGFTLQGQWTLPDGSTVDGTNLTWAPTASDFADSKVPVFSAWVDGFRQQTEASTAPRITVKKYVWPEWTIETKFATIQAPALIRVSVVAPKEQVKMFSSVNEKVTYTWMLPDNAVGARATRNSAYFVAEQPGDYVVQVKLEDTRGNEKVIEQTITVIEPKVMEADFKTIASNRYWRIPLDVNLKPRFYRGHPKERVTTYRFYRDGELIGENSKGRHIEHISQDGSYEFSVQADTTLGRTIEATVSVTAVPNKPPVCTLTNRPYRTSATVTAACKDPDGRIKSYSWRVDGQAISTSGYRISVPLGSSIEVDVTDDSGETITLNGSV